MSDSPERPQRPAWRERLRAAAASRMATYRSRSLAWRLLVPAALALAGLLFVTSATSSRGFDLRSGAYGDLAGLASRQSQRVVGLRQEANQLTQEIDRLSHRSRSGQVKALQGQVDALRGPAGLDPVSGPGLTVILNDAPPSVGAATNIDPNRLVVHQQDIQAVANALWAGGATAMTIQGQRVVATTGIKCVGNSVVLHGVPYAAPYVISAVGDPTTLLESVNRDPYIQIYKQYVEVYDLGWSLRVEPDLHLPAYDGTLDLGYARPAPSAGGRAAGGS